GLTATVVTLLAVVAAVVAFRTLVAADPEKVATAHGIRLMEEGDLLRSLPWFAEALRLGQGDPARAENHRIRLGAVLQQCPKLTQVWFHEGPVSHAEFSPDGRH